MTSRFVAYADETRLAPFVARLEDHDGELPIMYFTTDSDVNPSVSASAVLGSRIRIRIVCGKGEATEDGPLIVDAPPDARGRLEALESSCAFCAEDEEPDCFLGEVKVDAIGAWRLRLQLWPSTYEPVRHGPHSIGAVIAAHIDTVAGLAIMEKHLRIHDEDHATAAEWASIVGAALALERGTRPAVVAYVDGKRVGELRRPDSCSDDVILSRTAMLTIGARRAAGAVSRPDALEGRRLSIVVEAARPPLTVVDARIAFSHSMNQGAHAIVRSFYAEDSPSICAMTTTLVKGRGCRFVARDWHLQVGQGFFERMAELLAARGERDLAVAIVAQLINDDAGNHQTDLDSCDAYARLLGRTATLWHEYRDVAAIHTSSPSNEALLCEL
jgi:hypothetical protein